MPTMSYRAKINRNARAREYFWTVAIGKPTMSSTLWTTSSAATRRFGHNILNTQISKAIPVASSHNHSSPHQSIPRTTLSPVLQTYFYKMQRATYHTCHPRQIHAEAVKIVSSLLDRNEPAGNVAKMIYLAGITRIEYSRTVALVVHDCMTELIWRNWSLKKVLQRELSELAISALWNSWKNNDLHLLDSKTGLDPIQETLEATRTQILNVTAFFSDLFAMSLIPTAAMRSAAFFLINNLTTLTHCRGLYLMLLRASSHIATPLGEVFLLNCRALIVKRGQSMCSGMMRRWLIEIYNVINQTLARDTEVAHAGKPCYAPLACHRWDIKLSCNTLSETLRGIPSPKDHTPLTSTKEDDLTPV